MPTSIVKYDRALPFVQGRLPNEQPESHLEKDGDSYKVVQGRRSSKMLLVEKLREKVNKWRASDYKGASETSKRLLAFWFEEDHLINGERFRYYFCQREAIETLIFLTEVQGYHDLRQVFEDFSTVEQNFLTGSGLELQVTPDGKRSIRRFVSEFGQDITQDIPEPNLLRYAFKMATGSGKTAVMAFAIVWSYFNKTIEKRANSADNFLIVAPNVIVLERLQRDFVDGAIFRNMPMIPPEWVDYWKIKVIGRGNPGSPKLSGTIFVQNIQQLQSRAKDKWFPENVVQKILGRPAQSDIDKPALSVLDRVVMLPNLLVINDEAHHVHDEDLEWTKTLLMLHHSIPGGLTLWLDFSATPKDQNGTYYPWIVVDYPLAQAVEDLIVKVPIIVHRVTKKDPDNITQDNVSEVYAPWIVAALERWKHHLERYQQVGKKPVLFIMAEKNVFADSIADMIRKQKGIKPEEVLVIHTDLKGDVRTSDLEELRKVAMDIDRAKNKVKIVVSVLMLREGWDVQNVSVILGLRPFTSKAEILPEQAVGRGLRLMSGISPDSYQVLEVIGTSAFEDFVKQLETEGVGIRVVDNPPPLPIVVEPLKSKMAYDVEIPQTELQYSHNYKQLSSIDPLKIKSLVDSDELVEDQKIRLRMEFPITSTIVGEVEIAYDNSPPSAESLSRITSEVVKRARLVTSVFAELYPIVKEYVTKKCFGKEIEMESLNVRRRLADLLIQNAIASLLSKVVGQAVLMKNPVALQQNGVVLSKTVPFTWRRKHVICKKTIFNYVATFNDFESHFAEFLDRKGNDIIKFSALAETFTAFKIDYLSDRGAIRFYYPDFVAVQKTGTGLVHWIIETKGREYEDTDKKEAAITKWCKDISVLKKQEWRAIKVPQSLFEKHDYYDFTELVKHVEKNIPATVVTPVV